MKIKEFLKSVKGLSKNSLIAYEQTLWQLYNQTKSDDPSDEEILAFLSRYKTSSLHRHKAAIMAYFEYFKRPWPFGRRQFATKKSGIIRYVNPSIIPELIEAADDKDDAMFVKTLFTLGARISELRGIRRADIIDAGVHVLGKGGSMQLIPTTPDFNKELNNYAGKKRGLLFPKPYTYYYKQLKKMGKKVGMENISPHMLRHSRAIDLLDKKLPDVYVQQFLRHVNFNTTAAYQKITGGKLGDELNKVEVS